MRGTRNITSAVLESLESRQLFADMLALTAVAPINAFDGVGFRQNPVAYATYTKNGVGVVDPSGLKAEVNFGSGWESAGLAKLGTVGQFVVKASHTYNVGVAKTFKVQTRITGPGVSDVLTNSTQVNNSLMPAAASRPPASPSAWSRVPTPLDVKLFVTNASPFDRPFTTYAGVGFNRDQVAVFSSKFHGENDTDITHFKAQLNYGDGKYWFDADITRKGTSTINYVVKTRDHVYTAAGSYPITLFLTGYDGTTISQTVTTVTVKDLPAAASKPAKQAPLTSIGSAQDVWMAITNVPTITVNVGKAATNVTLGKLSAKVAGTIDTNAGGYMAFVNWGDSPTWQVGNVVHSGSSTNPMDVLGTHTYTKVGTYQVVLHLLGTDGTTLTQQTVTVKVV